MLTPFHAKMVIAHALDILCVNALLQTAQVRFLSPFIRAVYYHDVPPSEAGQFENQLRYFARHFRNVNRSDLLGFYAHPENDTRPGLILTFDDGFRSSCEVIAPLLEQYGFTGWFFVCPALLDIRVEDQPRAAAAHRIWPKPFAYDTPRVFLTWEQVLELDQKHVVGCHTLTHARLHANLTKEQLHRELFVSKQRLQDRLLHPVDTFAWVGGEEASYSNNAAEMIRHANYQFAFLTNHAIIRSDTDLHFLNRSHVDSNFSLALTRFQLSGLLDASYTPKRRRVAKCIRTEKTTPGKDISWSM